jgi:uncharacterized membrane protein (UPF0127 family)
MSFPSHAVEVFYEKRFMSIYNSSFKDSLKEGTLDDEIPKAELNLSIYNKNTVFADGIFISNTFTGMDGELYIFSEEAPATIPTTTLLVPRDILFINAAGIITAVHTTQTSNTEPLVSEIPIKAVLQLNAGEAEKRNLKAGDIIRW